MKTFIQTAFVVGLGIFTCSSQRFQDTQETNAATTNSGGAIVVLDVAKVFKEFPPFKQQIEDIQGRAEQLKAEVERRQTELRTKAQSVAETYEPNTKNRQDAEAKLEQDMTALRTYARQGETELMAQEAKVYYDTYQQMQTIVSEAAQQYGIALVLRYDSSEIDPNNRNSVVGGVNRAIVYQKDRDLTPHVIEKMNARFGTPLSANAAPTTQK